MSKPAMQVTLLVGVSAINNAIKGIKGRAAQLDRLTHQAAVSCLVHSAQHNDPDVVTRLLDALGKSQRKSALVAWLLGYGAFVQDDKGALKYDVKRTSQVLMQENIDKASADPFWEFMPDVEYKQFDLTAALASLLKKAEAAAKKPEQDAELVSSEMLAKIAALLG